MSKHPDSMMTPAQIARRIFKSSLPRKIENRRLSAMEALGETFTLLDRFRSSVQQQGLDPDKTVHAALAYCLPESDPAMLGFAILMPALADIPDFVADVLKLDRPLFLGVVFIQLDPVTENPNYRWASFCAQFMGGPEAESRLHFAQKMCLAGIESNAKKIERRK